MLQYDHEIVGRQLFGQIEMIQVWIQIFECIEF